MSAEKEYFPDGTEIDGWFYDAAPPEPKGKRYVLTDYGVRSDGRVYTKEIQAVIDTAARNGGGVVVVPSGLYMSGSIYFRQGVDLLVEKGGILMGSDDIADYGFSKTRIEGESCPYFDALINADGLDGFTISGEGVIDGNGFRSWRAFWLRREWNPDCLNKDEQRARLVYISNCKNVTVAGLTLQNSQFWTNHLYKCERVKFIGCRIFSPAAPVKAPSTDAVDIDVCRDVFIKGCYMEVNDDAVALKGGKGPWADTAEENGVNERIIIEDCTYGFCHGCLTCGSESVHSKNIIVRGIHVKEGNNLLWLKMRPDTPQMYEYILIENIRGKIENFITVRPWTQFYDLGGRMDIPMSYARNITMRNCELECERCFNIEPNEKQYTLSDFKFEELRITAHDKLSVGRGIKNVYVKNVELSRDE